MRRLALAPLGAVLVCGALALSGCPSTTPATLYTPITGIEIDSVDLSQGIGCGTQPDQIYKYSAIVWENAPDASQPVGSGLPVSGVFDCFAIGQFSNLPSPDGGNVEYAIDIFAYDEQAFPAALAPCVNLETDGAPPPCPGEVPANVEQYAPLATWTTTCTATEIQGVSGVAICNPLVAADAGFPASDAAPPPTDAGDATVPKPAGPSIEVETQAFETADGGTLRCGTDYDSVSTVYSAQGQSGTTPTLTCPTPVTLAPVAAGESYAITATLLRAGVIVGNAPCQAAVAADASSGVATCGPVTASGDL